MRAVPLCLLLYLEYRSYAVERIRELVVASLPRLPIHPITLRPPAAPMSPSLPALQPKAQGATMSPLHTYNTDTPHLLRAYLGLLQDSRYRRPLRLRPMTLHTTFPQPRTQYLAIQLGRKINPNQGQSKAIAMPPAKPLGALIAPLSSFASACPAKSRHSHRHAAARLGCGACSHDAMRAGDKGNPRTVAKMGLISRLGLRGYLRDAVGSIGGGTPGCEGTSAHEVHSVCTMDTKQGRFEGNTAATTASAK